jgi:hypothetical protein
MARTFDDDMDVPEKSPGNVPARVAAHTDHFLAQVEKELTVLRDKIDRLAHSLVPVMVQDEDEDELAEKKDVEPRQRPLTPIARRVDDLIDAVQVLNHRVQDIQERVRP